MEPGQGVQIYKSSWKPLCSGILLGILISFLALVVIAFKWGPQGESISFDLYSDNTIVHKFFLVKRTHTELPKAPHVQWAIKHQNPVRSWYLGGSSISRHEWFGDMLAADVLARSHVYGIYSLEIPEEEKVKLLHQYHQDLNAMKAKQDQYYESVSMDAFYDKWDQTLEQIKKILTEFPQNPDFRGLI